RMTKKPLGTASGPCHVVSLAPSGRQLRDGLCQNSRIKRSGWTSNDTGQHFNYTAATRSRSTSAHSVGDRHVRLFRVRRRKIAQDERICQLTQSVSYRCGLIQPTPAIVIQSRIDLTDGTGIKKLS